MEMINVLKRLAELDAMNPNIQTEGSKHASRPGTEKRPGSADQAQKTLDRKKEVKAAAEKRRSEKSVEEGFDDLVKGVKRKIAGKDSPEQVRQKYLSRAKDAIDDEHKFKHQAAEKKADKAADRYNKINQVVNKGVKEGFDVKDSSGKVVHTAFSQGEAKKKAEELSKSGNKHSVSYSRTSHPKEDVEEGLGYRGVGGARRYDDDEGWGSGWKKPAAKALYGVFIDGRKWKTFSDEAEANRVAAAVSKKYPEKSVKVFTDYARESIEEGNVSECGMMGADVTSRNHTPASINMSADSGEELTGMLRDIMQLAGLSKEGPEDSAADLTVLSPTPTLGVASSSDGDDMRSIIDKLNPAGDDDSSDGVDDEEETDESYDNTPADPSSASPYDSEEYAHHENPPGAAKGRGFTSNPRAVPEDIEARLFADYQEFINEGSKPDFLDADKDGNKKEPMKRALKQKMKK